MMNPDDCGAEWSGEPHPHRCGMPYVHVGNRHTCRCGAEWLEHGRTAPGLRSENDDRSAGTEAHARGVPRHENPHPATFASAQPRLGWQVGWDAAADATPGNVEGRVLAADEAASPWEDRPYLPLTDKAFEWAASAHQGQVDKIGEPYIEHPKRVSRAVYEATGSDEATAVALLHDVVEDTPVTLDQLRETGFPERVVAAVDAISKRKGEPFAAYYERVKANDLALVVKWHDVADNAAPRRLAKVAPDTRERLREKYERAKTLLATPENDEPALPIFGRKCVVCHLPINPDLRGCPDHPACDQEATDGA
jgi:hypothetical protein